MYSAFRPAEPGQLYHRIAMFLFPFWTLIPTGVLGLQVLARGWVPMDDEHTMFFSLTPKRGVYSGGVNRARSCTRTRPTGMGASAWYPTRRMITALIASGNGT